MRIQVRFFLIYVLLLSSELQGEEGVVFSLIYSRQEIIDISIVYCSNRNGVEAMYRGTASDKNEAAKFGVLKSRGDEDFVSFSVSINLKNQTFESKKTTAGSALEVYGNNGGLVSNLTLLDGYFRKGEIGEMLVLSTESMEKVIPFKKLQMMPIAEVQALIVRASKEREAGSP